MKGMNHLKKSLVSIMIAVSMIIAVIPSFGMAAYAAEEADFGGYNVLAFDNETDYTKNAETVATDIGLTNFRYNDDIGEFYGGGNGKSKRFQIKAGNAFKNNYKYVKIVWKTNKLSNPADTTVELYARDTSYNWYDSKETQNNEGSWTVSTADFSSKNNINTFELDFGKTTESEWTEIYVKYIAFFETEAGMKAYDRDVISASVDGNAAEVDNFNKKITYDVPYGTEYTEGSEPQLVVTQGTTAVKDETGYQITDYKGAVNH